MRWLLLLLLLLATAARADGAGPTFGNPYAFTEQGGAAVYAAVCAACHMPDGRGAIGAGAYPALAANPRLAAAGYPILVVLRGRKAMPAAILAVTVAEAAEREGRDESARMVSGCGMPRGGIAGLCGRCAG